jgi:hypothetical protein
MGKSSIVYVIGLSLIIGIALANINETSMGSMDSYTTYFGRTMAHNIALAAANVGANRVLFDYSYSSSFSGPFGGGTYSVAYSDTGSANTYVKFMDVVAAFNSGGETIRDTVRAVFGRRQFSIYGWFTEEEKNGYIKPNGSTGPYYGASDWKITGDSVFGYAHTNYKFNLAGRPYFDRKVTGSLGGVQDPIYNEGYEWGVTINRDTANIGTLRTLANAGNPFAAAFDGNDVGLEFFNTGDVHVRIPHNTGATLDTTVPVSVLSSTRVIGAVNGDLHLKGTYRGKVTVCAFTGTGATAKKGNIWVDGDLVAADNPRTNPASTDMLGVVAERMGYITKDLTRTTSSVLNIQAAIYCHNGEFTAEDFWSIPKSGRVSLYGSITQKTAGSLGVFSFSSGLLNGYFYSIRHDPRFLSVGPPAFPFSSKLKLIAWWEN